ncbi:tripartite tricarboxylate transporter TctB family protein [Hydrogenophaga aquatica]
MHTSHPRLPGELSFMALIVAFSTFMLWASYNISKFESISSAGAFPMVCAAAMLVTGLMSLVKTARAKLSLEGGETWLQQFVHKLAPPQLVLFAVVIGLYMFLLERLGFLVSSYLFLVCAMQLLGSRRTVLNMLISALMLAAIYIVFQTAFSVVLPAGTWLAPYLPEYLK